MVSRMHPDPHETPPLSGFVASLQEPSTPHISPRRLSEALGIQIGGLAEIAGVHRNTLRNPASERLQGRLRDMVKVITAAAALAGDVDRALYWFKNEPIAVYRHKTAAELVAEGRLDAVLAYLEDLGNGANG